MCIDQRRSILTCFLDSILGVTIPELLRANSVTSSMPHLFRSHKSHELLSSNYNVTEAHNKTRKYHSLRLTKRLRDFAPPPNQQAPTGTATQRTLVGAESTDEQKPSSPPQLYRRRRLTKSNAYKQSARSIFSKPHLHLTNSLKKKRDKKVKECALLDPAQLSAVPGARLPNEDVNTKRSEVSSEENVFQAVQRHGLIEPSSRAMGHRSGDLEPDLYVYETTSERILQALGGEPSGVHQGPSYWDKPYPTVALTLPSEESIEEDSRKPDGSSTSEWTTDFEGITESPTRSDQDPFQDLSDQRLKAKDMLSDSPLAWNSSARSITRPSLDPFRTPSGTDSEAGPPRNPFQTPSIKISHSHRSQSRSSSRASLGESSSSRGSGLYLSPPPATRDPSAAAVHVDTDIENTQSKSALKKIRRVSRFSLDAEALESCFQHTNAYRRVRSNSDTTRMMALTGQHLSDITSLNQEPACTGQSDNISSVVKEWKHAASNFFPPWARGLSQEQAVKIILGNREKLTGKAEDGHELIPWLKPAERAASEAASISERHTSSNDSDVVEERQLLVEENPVITGKKRNVSDRSWGSLRGLFGPRHRH